MRQDLGGEFLVIVALVFIYQTVDNLLQWLRADWHWLQLVAPVAIIGGATLLLHRRILAAPRWAKMIVAAPLCCSPILFVIFQMFPVEGIAVFSLGVEKLQTWEVVTAICLTVLPVLAADGLIAKWVGERTDGGLPIDVDEEDKERRLRSPYGDATELSDDGLRRIGML
jgi:hypothetical protein